MNNVPRIGFVNPLNPNLGSVSPLAGASSGDIKRVALQGLGGGLGGVGTVLPMLGALPVVPPAQEHFTTFKFHPDGPDMRVALSMPAFKASPALHPVTQAQLAAIVQDIARGNIPEHDGDIDEGKRDFTLKEITGYSINLKTGAITFYGTKVGTNWYGGEKKTHYKVECNLVDDSKLSAAERVDLDDTLTAMMNVALADSGYNPKAETEGDLAKVIGAVENLYGFSSWQDGSAPASGTREMAVRMSELRSRHQTNHARDRNSWMDHPMKPFDRRWLTEPLTDIERERGRGEAVVPQSRLTAILQILGMNRSVAELLKLPVDDPGSPADEQLKQNGIVDFVSHKWPQPGTVEAAPPAAPSGGEGSNPQAGLRV